MTEPMRSCKRRSSLSLLMGLEGGTRFQPKFG
jgi:hypothetical protein